MIPFLLSWERVSWCPSVFARSYKIFFFHIFYFFSSVDVYRADPLKGYANIEAKVSLGCPQKPNVFKNGVYIATKWKNMNFVPFRGQVLTYYLTSSSLRFNYFISLLFEGILLCIYYMVYDLKVWNCKRFSVGFMLRLLIVYSLFIYSS